MHDTCRRSDLQFQHFSEVWCKNQEIEVHEQTTAYAITSKEHGSQTMTI